MTNDIIYLIVPISQLVSNHSLAINYQVIPDSFLTLSSVTAHIFVSWV